MWIKIAGIILRNRQYFIAGSLVITVFMLWQLSKVKMDYHYANMLSDSHPVFIDNVRFKEVFGDEANVIVCGFTDDKLFELERFNSLQRICREIKKLENVSNVISVPQVLNIKQQTITDEDGRTKREFQTFSLFPEYINSQQELDSLKTIFYDLPFYKNFLYNDSTNVFLISISIEKDILNSKERIPTVLAVEKLLRDYAQKQNLEIHISGMPFIRTHMMILIREEIKLFIVLAAIICVLILYLLFRSFKVIGVSIAVVGMGVIWAIGLMGILDYKITILSGMIPPLLIVIGIPNVIFLMNKYHLETKNHGNKVLALQRVIRKIGNAIFLTNLTTAAGFATFIITNSRYLVEFGIVASAGIMFVFLIALTIIPSVFSYLDAPSLKYTKHLDSKLVSRFVSVLLNLVMNHRKTIYGIMIIILILSVFGITKIHRTGYFLDDVKTEDPIYIDLKFFEKNFNGASPLEILIQSKDSLTNYDRISQIEKLDQLQNSLKRHPELSRSMSVADAVKFLYQAYSRGNPDNFALPPNPRTYETIFERLPKGINNNILHSFVDSTNTIVRVSLNVEDIGTARMEKLLPKVRDDIRQAFPEESFDTVVTGSTIMYFVGSQYLINNLFISLSLAVIVISIFLFLMFRSGKMVIISLIPNIIPMCITAALMGYFGIPLKPSTILVFSIAFGISVDNTIHYLAKYRQELHSNRWRIKISAEKALKEASVSMMYTSAVLFFGFAIFTASDFGGTVALGLLVSIALLVAMFSNLVILPSLLFSLDKYFTRKKFKEPTIKIYEDDD